MTNRVTFKVEDKLLEDISNVDQSFSKNLIV